MDGIICRQETEEKTVQDVADIELVHSLVWLVLMCQEQGVYSFTGWQLIRRRE